MFIFKSYVILFVDKCNLESCRRMADEGPVTGTPSVSFGGLSIKDFDQGIMMYLGIFKTAAQATGKGLKTAATKAGGLKDAAISRAGQIRDRASAAMRPGGQKTEKPVTPRQEHFIAQGPTAMKPVQGIDPAIQQETYKLLREHNISY